MEVHNTLEVKEDNERRKKAYIIVDECIKIYTHAVVKNGANQVPLLNFVVTKVDWEKVHEQIARRLSDAATAFGGISIKAAQFMALRSDLPKPYLNHFSNCFEEGTRCSPFTYVKRKIEPFLKEIQDLPPTPNFSASVAQVHFCKYRGKNAVLKILHDGIAESYAFDVQLMSELGKYVDGYNEAKGAAVVLGSISEKLKNIVGDELNMQHEAENQMKVRSFFEKNDLGVIIPEVYECTNTILIMERVEGNSVAATLKRMQSSGSGFKNDLSSTQREKIYDAYGQMIFNLRFTQIDAHPGNILILPNGNISIIDYGQAIEVTDEVLNILTSFISQAPIDDVQMESQAVSEWLAIIGINVQMKDAINTANLLFFAEGEGVFPHIGSMDNGLVPFVLLLLYLSRLERNIAEARCQCNLRDRANLYVVFQSWKKFIGCNIV